MQTNNRQIFYKPSQVQKYLGITRSVLTYWVDKLQLITPAERLPGLSLFDFGNLLSLGLIKTLTDVGIRATELKAVMKLITPALGPGWERIKEITRMKDRAKIEYIGLELQIRRGRGEIKISASIRDQRKSPLRIGGVKKKLGQGESNSYQGVVNIGIPLNLILIHTSIFTGDKSWWFETAEPELKK